MCVAHRVLKDRAEPSPRKTDGITSSTITLRAETAQSMNHGKTLAMTMNETVKPTGGNGAASPSAAGPNVRTPKTPAGWTLRPAARPAARPALLDLLDLLHAQDAAAEQAIAASLDGRARAAGLLPEAARAAYEHDRLWAAEVPARDGSGRAVGRVIVGTTETGNVGTYHEGGRGVVGLGPGRPNGELVLLESPMDAWAANAAGVNGVTFAAEHAGWRNPAWAKQAVRPNAVPLTDPTLKSLMRRLLAA